MTFLGVRDGVGLRFGDGALSAIELQRFGRTFDLHEDFSAAPGPLGEPLPYLPLEISLDISDARYRGLDPYSGRQAHQALSAGQRTLSILQGQSLLGSGLPEPLVARTHMDISLAAPLSYCLRTSGDAVWQSDEAGAEAYLAQGCTVRVSATSALAIEDNGHSLRMDLPAGLSTVEMWVEGQPPLPFAPAVVVCLPRQMREAAIVASAIGSPDKSYIPILDLDLPPSSTEDFQAANARLGELSAQIGQIEQQMQTVTQQGAQAASGLILPGARSAEQSIEQLERQRAALLSEAEPLQQRLMAYANWSRRSAMLTGLIGSLTAGATESRQLFVLAPYPADLLAEWAATATVTVLFQESAASQVETWQSAVLEMLPAGQVEIVFWKDAAVLAAQVWTQVHGQGRPAFFTIPDEPAYYPVGLLDALRRGRCLLPRGRAGAQVKLDDILDGLNAGNTSDHAVIVEADGSAASLIGALYAHHSGARLYMNPLPQAEQAFERLQVITEGIQKEHLSALAANAYRYIGEHRKMFMQSQAADPQFKQVAAGLSILELPTAVPSPYSDQAFVQALSTYLTAQQAGAQQGYRYDDAQWQKDLAALEGQVTVGVSEHVRQAVANVSRVTAFTAGLLYSLAAGFEGKAVGLVLRDLAAPYILRAIAHANVGRPSVTLGLNVDPGLTPRPAPEVAEVADRTITLRGAAASVSNIALLSAVLPLDTILLHTQGNVDSLILTDARNRLMEVHAAELGAQVHLNSTPLVIYMAPLAWLGVGVTMLEQGAGGFVGALWPVRNGGEEDVVRLLLTATLAKSQNPAQALLSLPGYDTRASRGFVYLGTAADWPAAGANLVESVPTLYAAAVRLAATGRVDVATLVYDRMRALVGETAAGLPGLRAELLLLDADFQARLASRNRERPAQDLVDKVSQNLDVLDKMSLPEAQKKDLQVTAWERAAVLEMAAENYDRAQELLAAVRAARRSNGQMAGELSAAYLLAIVQERQRRWAPARQTLLDVQAGLASLGNAVGMVLVATSLAYVSLPLAMYPDVLSHLKLAMQGSLALGIQILSETLMQTLSLGRAMAQMGAVADLATMAHTLSGLVRSDTHLPENERAAIADVLALMEETAQVLQAALSAEEREPKLAALVEKAQANELARSLGVDAWILGVGTPPQAGKREGTQAG